MLQSKNIVFNTTNFRYLESKNPLVPDQCIFVQGKERYTVVFDQDLQWHKTIKRHTFKHEQDMLLGRVIGESKIFRILQDNITIEWVFKNIPYENIIL